jgi:hypothetical protein
MAKISDDLRGFADAEVLSAIQISALKRMASYIDYRMVELPLSADGYVWTGREECFWTNAEKEGYHSFGCVALRNGKWHVEDIDGMDYEAESVWYERPDSLERIADELDEQAGSLTKDGYTWQEDAIHDFAVRIRKLAEREGK